MMTGDRNQTRRMFHQAWTRAQRGDRLEPMEQLISEVVAVHPEYHSLVENLDRNLERDFTPDGGAENPFMHMGMHIAIREQVMTDRPQGIAAAYRQLVERLGDQHQAEHRIMECLGEMLWKAQRSGGMPDESAYLACIRRL